jgi:hypothetical protein
MQSGDIDAMAPLAKKAKISDIKVITYGAVREPRDLHTGGGSVRRTEQSGASARFAVVSTFS